MQNRAHEPSMTNHIFCHSTTMFWLVNFETYMKYIKFRGLLLAHLGLF